MLEDCGGFEEELGTAETPLGNKFWVRGGFVDEFGTVEILLAPNNPLERGGLIAVPYPLNRDAP